MTNNIVPTELVVTAYQLPAEHRQAILAQAQTDVAQTAGFARAMREIEKQRQQFIEMYGDSFGLNAGN